MRFGSLGVFNGCRAIIYLALFKHTVVFSYYFVLLLYQEAGQKPTRAPRHAQEKSATFPAS